jgi:hypothetical protein
MKKYNFTKKDKDILNPIVYRRQRDLVENRPKISFIFYNYNLTNLGNNIDCLGTV